MNQRPPDIVILPKITPRALSFYIYQKNVQFVNYIALFALIKTRLNVCMNQWVYNVFTSEGALKESLDAAHRICFSALSLVHK